MSVGVYSIYASWVSVEEACSVMTLAISRPMIRRMMVFEHTDLSLDLLTSPSSSLGGARSVVAIRSCILDHLRNPILTEEVGELSSWESICQITTSY